MIIFGLSSKTVAVGSSLSQAGFLSDPMLLVVMSALIRILGILFGCFCNHRKCVYASWGRGDFFHISYFVNAIKTVNIFNTSSRYS